jgi:hypothetical protein
MMRLLLTFAQYFIDKSADSARVLSFRISNISAHISLLSLVYTFW